MPKGAPANTAAYNETDNNADTCVMGKNFHVCHSSGRVADVFGFRGDYDDPDEIHIATGTTAFDHPDGYVILLTFHEALWYGSFFNKPESTATLWD